MRKTTILIGALSVVAVNVLFAQNQPSVKADSLSLHLFLTNVSKGNLGYIAQQFNVPIAQAQLRAARVFDDPELSVNYSNNQDQTMKMGQSWQAGLSYPINLGNKRGANIGLARSQYELSQLTLDDYLFNLRADAALGYYSTLKLQKIYLLQKDTYDQLLKLAKADSLRHADGEASELDAMQTALEARSQLNAVSSSRADMENAIADLATLQGKPAAQTASFPSDDFPLEPHDFFLPKLIAQAQQNRGAIKMAIKNREISEKNLRLLRANRAFEFNLNAQYAYNSVVKNDIAPAPSYNTLSAGISIPLKFSNLNRGALHAAQLTVEQNKKEVEDTQLQIESEVTKAYNSYLAAKKQIDQYHTGLIESARKILEGRIYSYRRGETGLVDVINAQHTYNDLRNDYLEIVYGYVSALIELERAAGIWNIDKK
jgi:cobalt-zinc-cadmium efflux system outer membrane protein